MRPSSPPYTDEQNGLITGEIEKHPHSHRPRRSRSRGRLHITRLTALGLSLTFFTLFTICIYLLLLLRNLPLEVQTLLTPTPSYSNTASYGYDGPLPIHHDATLGPYIECEAVEYPATPPDCSFDLLANGWVPNPCFDAQMHRDYVDGRDYEFYRDPEGTERVAQEEILRGNISAYAFGLWVSFREHVEHCWYLVNSTVVAMAGNSGGRGRGRLDIWVDEKHMQHCLGVVREQRHEEGYIDLHIRAVFENHRCYLGW
ncbi:hypothetical protein BJX61DRAFT_539185 [Aspergillus egyptiacus]|nr:hypothetical protein BJX61DRAFT_539185 [Aspergillus egyptiacus]